MGAINFDKLVLVLMNQTWINMEIYHLRIFYERKKILNIVAKLLFETIIMFYGCFIPLGVQIEMLALHDYKHLVTKTIYNKIAFNSLALEQTFEFMKATIVAHICLLLIGYVTSIYLAREMLIILEKIDYLRITKRDAIITNIILSYVILIAIFSKT